MLKHIFFEKKTIKKKDTKINKFSQLKLTRQTRDSDHNTRIT
jgi:hypothetical protein